MSTEHDGGLEFHREMAKAMAPDPLLAEIAAAADACAAEAQADSYGRWYGVIATRWNDYSKTCFVRGRLHTALGRAALVRLAGAVLAAIRWDDEQVAKVQEGGAG